MSPASFSAGIDSPVSAACWTWRSRASSRRASAGTRSPAASRTMSPGTSSDWRSEEHTSELQSQSNLVCRLLLEIKTQPARVLPLAGVEGGGGTANDVLGAGLGHDGNYNRHCERSEPIQSRASSLDCFVASLLAM